MTFHHIMLTACAVPMCRYWRRRNMDQWASYQLFTVLVTFGNVSLNFKSCFHFSHGKHEAYQMKQHKMQVWRLFLLLLMKNRKLTYFTKKWHLYKTPDTCLSSLPLLSKPIINTLMSHTVALGGMYSSL